MKKQYSMTLAYTGEDLGTYNFNELLAMLNSNRAIYNGDYVASMKRGVYEEFEVMQENFEDLSPIGIRCY